MIAQGVERRALALPAGLFLVGGLALILFALHGLDQKHNLLGGKLAGAANATSTSATGTGSSTTEFASALIPAQLPTTANHVIPSNTVRDTKGSGAFASPGTTTASHTIPVRNG